MTNYPLSVPRIRPAFHRRTDLPEIMDDLDFEPEVIRSELDNLARINYWLGGDQVVLSALEEVIPLLQTSAGRPLRIADLGCGGGDILRKIARRAEKSGWPVELYGIDVNPTCVEYAREKTADYSMIQIEQADCFSPEFADRRFDIVICSLFLHHFQDEKLRILLSTLSKVSQKALIINDLQRHWLPFYLFRLVTWMLRAPAVVRYDGSVSVMRGFTRSEWETLVRNLNPVRFRIRWKWAFRHQVVVYTG